MDIRQQIVELCKERIAAAKDKENLRIFLYDIIGALNRGEKNPLKIPNQGVAENVLETIRKYGTEDQSNKALNILGKWQNILPHLQKWFLEKGRTGLCTFPEAGYVRQLPGRWATLLVPAKPLCSQGQTYC